MAMIEKIRKQSWLLLTMVGIGLLSFLVPYDAVMSMFGNTNNTIGEIDGHSISAQEWQKAIIDREPLFQYKGNEQNLSNDTWAQLTENFLYGDEYEEVGLQITEEEYDEITFGEVLSPYVLQTIYGGQDSTALKDQVRKSFDGMDPKMANGWKVLIAQKRQKEKYDAMLKKGMYANSIDAKWAFKVANDKVSVDYVVKTFAEIPDSTITWNDGDIRAYYNKHKNDREYKQETSRSVNFINFPVQATSQDSGVIRESLTGLYDMFAKAASDSMFAANNSATPANAYFNYVEGTLSPEFEAQVKSDSVGRIIGPIVVANAYKLIKISKRGLDNNSVEARHILIKNKLTGKSTLDSLKKVIEKSKNFEELAKKYSEDPGSGANGGGLGKFGRGQMVKPFEDACFNGAIGSLQIVESDFGWHLIEVTGKNFPYTKIAEIQKLIEPSSKTVKAAYASAKDFTINYADTASFRIAADTLNGGTKITQAKNIKPNATSITGLSEAGEVVSWAYSAELGEISQPMMVNNQYVIAALVDIREKGTPTLANVYDKMKEEVIKEKKAEQLAEEMKGNEALADLATRVKSTVKKGENLTMKSGSIPGSGVNVAENMIIGACFGIKTGNISQPIVGKGGVYVIQRTADITPGTSADNYLSDQDKAMRNFQQRAASGIFNSFREAANIEDNRFERR
jgi:peptidyl-prolyl cis-trans isomerase D